MKLHEKLLAIQTKVKAPKGQYNKFGNFTYRSAEDILESVKPLNAEQGLVLTLSDEIKEIAGRIYVVATATISDGTDELKVSAFAREPESKKGMDESQITGATSSYARKYALNGLYAIDDNKDADTDEHYNQQNNGNQKAKSQAKEPTKEEQNKELHDFVKDYKNKFKNLNVNWQSVVDYLCDKHNVGNIFDVKPNLLVGELKVICGKKSSEIRTKNNGGKTW